jgi:hypothetical protein
MVYRFASSATISAAWYRSERRRCSRAAAIASKTRPLKPTE